MNKLQEAGVSWVVIGSQTKPTKPPKIEWVQEIVEAADRAGVPVFLKDNLLELVNYQSPKTEFAFNKGFYRQEQPKPHGYRAARGVAPRSPDAPIAEEAIRRGRDDE